VERGVRGVDAHPGEIQGLVLLDSLYAPYAKDEHGDLRQGVVFTPPLRPVVSLGKQAVGSGRLLFLTFSRAATRGYASTEEVAKYLLGQLGLHASVVSPGDDPRGPIARLDRGQLHLRGHRGSDARAHCAHLRYAGEAVRAIRQAFP
jgi:hypothetical protein